MNNGHSGVPLTAIKTRETGNVFTGVRKTIAAVFIAAEKEEVPIQISCCYLSRKALFHWQVAHVSFPHRNSFQDIQRN